MSVLPGLKEDRTKHRICMNVHWEEYELCSFAGHRQISALTASKHSCKTLASPLTGIKPVGKYRNISILVNEVFLGLFSVFVIVKLTVGWVFTGKLCLCSALRMNRRAIKYCWAKFFLKSPLNSTHAIFVLFSQSIPKYPSSYLSRLSVQASLDNPLITTCNIFSKICKHGAGTNSEKL